MCNLYSQTRNVEAIRRLFRVSSNRAAAVEPRDAIFPGHAAPVVRKADDGERELVELSWGFVLPQAGKAPRRVTNTRDDKVQSPFWRDRVRLRRCLVPNGSPSLIRISLAVRSYCSFRCGTIQCALSIHLAAPAYTSSFVRPW